MDFFESLKDIRTIEDASELLHSLTIPSKNIEEGITFAVRSHEGQTRKSGEPYVVHPILVASIVAYMGGDESMVISALLHDVIEDTSADEQLIRKKFGEDVYLLVDGLTKIDIIRDEKLIPSSSNEKLVISALSFRKMLLASIKDIRVLVIKLCDRLHNMLTLDALPEKKQLRIAEETLVVYAPIAHRLGISSIKNELEDQSFYYIFPSEWHKIQNYLKENTQEIQLKLNQFISKLTSLLMNHGFPQMNFKINSRIKRPYSIYLKMQRKGVSIDEVLDLLAVRIIVDSPLDCYKVLGIIHLNFKPIIARFKDYVTIPKENGYQTIHTTVFDESIIFEIQIRTKDMHKSAEYGVAAHWKYKTGGREPNLDWLNNLQLQNENDNIEEFYELVKHDLYSEDISVFSPKGDIYTLPQGAVVLDFAYAIHSEVGDNAKIGYVNKERCSLLTVLKNGDIVRIVTIDQPVPRCSWIDAVKTSRAKSHIRQMCTQRLKEIDKKSAYNILATVFDKEPAEIRKWVQSVDLEHAVHKIAQDVNYLREIKNRLKNSYRKQAGLLTKIKIKILKLKEFKFDNLLVYSNYNVSDVAFDYCCHPKRGDEIVAFKQDSRVFVHHKLCDKAYDDICEGSQMVFAEWVKDDLKKYKLVISLDNKKGMLAQFLQFLSDNDINVLSIELGKSNEGYTNYCELLTESTIKENKAFKNLVERKYKIIDLLSLDDAYNDK